MIALGGRKESQYRSYGPVWDHTHTIATGFGFASLPTDPEVSGTAVHYDGEITEGGTDLNDGSISDIVRAVTGDQLRSLLV